MDIRSATFKSFSVFEKAEFQFCNGINVLIGTNATGKSHVMKALYCLLKANETSPWRSDNEALTYRVQLLSKLTKVFRPQSASVRRLVERSAGKRGGSVELRFAGSGGLTFQIKADRIGFKLNKLAIQR